MRDVMQRFIRGPRGRALGALALLLALAALAGAWIYAFSPARYVVATGPAEEPETRVMVAFAQALEARKANVRLRIVPHADLRASAQALGAGRADLGVARADLLLPEDGSTLAILREEALVALAPDSAKEDDLAAFAGRRIVLVERHPDDRQGFMRAMRAALDAQVEPILMNAGEAAAALREKRAQAVVFFAPPGAGARAIVHELAGAGRLKALAFEESAAVALADPAFTLVALQKGSVAARPPLPEEETKTLAVSWRLMARAGLDRGSMSRLVELLFQSRTRIARTERSVHLMKAPESEGATSAPVPNHTGALDYFNREQLTFMDRYGDWLWFALFAGGGVSSALAWIVRLFARRRREAMDVLLDRLARLMDLARRAPPEELDAIGREIDHQVKAGLRLMRRGLVDARALTGLSLAVAAARDALADRRRACGGPR